MVSTTPFTIDGLLVHSQTDNCTTSIIMGVAITSQLPDELVYLLTAVLMPAAVVSFPKSAVIIPTADVCTVTPRWMFGCRKRQLNQVVWPVLYLSFIFSIF